MSKKTVIILSLNIFCFLCACELDPLKDDPTTVGNFKSSKFDGFWNVTNPPWNLDIPPGMYIFKKNTVQIFNNKPDYGSGINHAWEANEFMYSNTHIYTYEFYNSWEWYKTPYMLSADGKKLTYGNLKLEKYEVKPWTKEDLMGSWYRRTTSFMLTFYEDCIMSSDRSYPEYIDISLTNESFKGKMRGNKVETWYYYIIDDKLFLSGGAGHGQVLSRYIEED